MQLFGQGMVAFKRKNIGLSCKKALFVKRLSRGAAGGIELCQCGGILAGMRRLHLNIELHHGAGAKAEAADAKPKRIAVENFILDVGEIISGSEIEEMLRPSRQVAKQLKQAQR